MIRTQLYLDEAVHARMRDLARKQGRTLSDLVREALERAYGKTSFEEQMRTAQSIEGLWKDRNDIEDTDAYVRRLRQDTRRSRRNRD
jgi:predicted DNA-binding protein